MLKRWGNYEQGGLRSALNKSVLISGFLELVAADALFEVLPKEIAVRYLV